jgi:GH43 family beta-xylosidase
MAGAAFRNPVITDDDGTDHGDPFVVRHRGDYWLYHTTDDGDRGISLWRSTDLVRWSFEGFALEPGGPGHWAQTDLWAPEVMYRGGWFWMYVAGTRLGDDGHGVEALRRQGLARSRTPQGPFALDPEPLVPDVWSIDGHPFQDDDGTLWLFYNVRTEETRFQGRPGSGTVVDRLVRPDRLEGRPTPVAFPSERWEGSFADDAYWNEASWVLKRRGRYYQLYSGGFYRDATYGIGVTAAERPRGPWHKDPANPLFRSGRRITGPGHHSIILAPDGVTPYSVYHGYEEGRSGRKVHLDRVEWAGDRPVIGSDPWPGTPTEEEQPLPPPAVHHPGVGTWQADLWVAGTAIVLGGVRVPLDTPPGPWRVRANQGEQALRVWVDGELVCQEPGVHEPRIEAEGEVLARSLASHLEDEAVHWVAPREWKAWSWGGRRPCEVLVAVRGAARLEVGEERAHVTSPPDRYALLRLLAPAGCEQIRVVAEAGGAHVTDLRATAR